MLRREEGSCPSLRTPRTLIYGMGMPCSYPGYIWFAAIPALIYRPKTSFHGCRCSSPIAPIIVQYPVKPGIREQLRKGGEPGRGLISELMLMLTFLFAGSVPPKNQLHQATDQSLSSLNFKDPTRGEVMNPLSVV
jgi:hypothetical protein